MKILTLVLCAAFIFAPTVRAQNGSPKPEKASPAFPSLADLYQRAVNDEKLIDAAIVNESKNDDLQICNVLLLRLQKRYASWFQGQYQTFLEVGKQLEGFVRELRSKVNALKEVSVLANAVQSQTANQEVSYDKIVAYLKQYNKRIKNCEKDGKEKVELLKRTLESDFTLNPFQIAHSQFVDVMKTMTTNLNASLKESGAVYQLRFAEAACGYDFELTSTLKLQTGQVREFKVSLLDEAALNSIGQDEQAQWKYLFGGQRVGDYSANGAARYVEMHEEMVDPLCGIDGWSNLIWEEQLTRSALPYESFESAKAILAAASTDDGATKTWKNLVYSRAKFREAKPQSASNYPPFDGDCRQMVATVAPGSRPADQEWLCGYSSNTLVPGLGNDSNYKGCLNAKMSQKIFDGNTLTRECKAYAQKASASECVQQFLDYAPELKVIFGRVFCGEQAVEPWQLKRMVQNFRNGKKGLQLVEGSGLYY